MSDEFTHHVLRMVVARICQPLGVHGMQNSVCDALADILKNYLLTLGKTTAAYSWHANRTDPTLGDLQQAFNDLGIHLSDLSDFTREVESLSLIHHIPLYPAPRTSSHIHQLSPGSETLTRQSRRGSLSSEDEIERERIPSYFPPLPSTNEDKDETMQEDVPGTPNETTENLEAVETITGIPSSIDPLKGLPQLSRARGFSSDLSEDGDGGSRRNSIGEWSSIGAESSTSKQAEVNTKSEGALIGNSTPVSTSSTKQPVSEDVFVAPSSLTRSKGSVFESTATDTRKLSESLAKDSKSQKNDSPVSNQLGKISPLIDAKRVQPPPLRLMSPSTTEPPNPVFPVQQPPLSPLSRSPLPQLTGRPRMPVLSPLRVPPRPHPLAGSQVISPSWKDVPPLRSPTERVQPVIPIGAHQTSSTSPSTTQIGTSSFPISAQPSIQTHTSPKQTDTPIQTSVAMVTKNSPPIGSPDPEHESTFRTQYKLPKSPEKVPLRDFNVVAERICITGRRISKSSSKSRSPTPVMNSPQPSLPLASQQVNEDIDTKVEQDLSLSPSEDDDDDASVTSEPSHHNSVSPSQDVGNNELVKMKQSPTTVEHVELSSPHSPTKIKSPLPATAAETDDPKNVSHLSDISSDEFEDVEEPNRDTEAAQANEHENNGQVEDTKDGESLFENKDLHKDQTTIGERKTESPVSSPLTEPEQFQSPVSVPELPPSPIPEPEPSPGQIPEPISPGHIPEPVSSPGQIPEPELPSSPVTESEQYPDDTIEASPPRSEEDGTISFQASKFTSDRDEHSKSRSSSPSLVSDTQLRNEEERELVFEQNSNLETPFGSSEDQVMNIHEVVETMVEKRSVQLMGGGGAGVSDDVLEILGQNLSSDDSEESREGSDMIETASALPEPQVIVTTKQVKGRGRKVSRDELFGIKKDKKPSSKTKQQPPSNPPSLQRGPLSLSLPITIDRHLLSSLKQEPKLVAERSASLKTSLLLTKAEMKTELSPLPRTSGVSLLKVTSGPMQPVGLSPSHVPSVSPGSCSHEPRGSEEEASRHEESVPLLISISRRLLRDTRFAITTPVEERAKLPQTTTAERVKMRLARFSSTLTIPSGPVGGALTVTTPTLNPRKRELDVSEVGVEGVGDSVAKRQRMDEHQVYVNPPHQQLSSSSSSSSSDEDDSGSDSLSCTPSPLPPPSPLTKHPSHQHSSSSADEDEPSTPASSESSTLSGKGLKLTISKAILQQAAVQLRTGSGSSKKGSTRGVGRPAKQVKTRKKAPKRTSLPAIPPPTVAESKKGARRKQTPRGSKGEGVDRGSKKSTISGGSGLVIKSSKPIVLAPPSRPRVPPIATPTPSHGSEYHCPECGLRDDGSPMIGCDGCDSWVHWTCAGVTREPPEDEKWYCSSCVARRGGAKGGKKGRKKRKRPTS